ncbi:MAG: hypothetical protein ACOYJU_01730 [Anaerovoracaceae bacterium]|jgi:hypothetical protein
MIFYMFMLKAFILCAVIVGVSYILGLALGMHKGRDATETESREAKI